MAKITRYTGNLLAFAANSTGTNRTVFGGLTQSDTLDNNVNADFLTGWEIVGVNENPTREDFNAMGFTLGQLIAYLHQWGVAEWDSLQEYNDGSITNVAGVLFESKVDANIGNDPTTDDGTNWRQLDDNSITVATITPAADTNVTLTPAQYRADVLILADGSWTTGHNVITPGQPRLYWVDNSGGTYDANVTTSGGAGVIVSTGTKRVVYDDGTNVVDPLTGITANVVGYKNAVHNGNFSINQRVVSGSVVLGAGVYGHDRWKAGAGGCTYTFATSNNATTLTITAGTLQQVVFGEDLLSGVYTLSWDGTAQAQIDGGGFGNSGIQGTVTGGTDVTIEFGTGTVSKVQFEPGETPTRFEMRPESVELDFCRRVYRKSYDQATAPATATANGATATRRAVSGEVLTVFDEGLYPPMRAVPTITFYSPNDGVTPRVYDTTAATNVIVTGTSTIQPASERKIGAPTHAASGSAGNIITAQWTASCEP